MRTRADQFNRVTEKPAAKYLEWSSDEKKLRYWDNETKEDVFVDLPFKFVVLMEMHTIRGFHEKSNSRIYSNEVEDLKEVLTVKSFEGGIIAKGAYSTIKDQIGNAGGHYSKSIYIQTMDGEIWNINLKGSAVFAWGEFVKKDRKNLISHSVVVSGAESLKKGKIDYSIPVFEIGKAISPVGLQKADEKFNELLEKLSARAQSLAAKEKEEEANDGNPSPLEKARKATKETESEVLDEYDDFPDPNLPDEAEVDF